MTQNTPTRRIYRKAPIIEALIDIQVEPANNFDLSVLETAARDRFINKYPLVEQQIQTQFRIPLNATPLESPVSSQKGLRFTSPDGKQILQIKNNSFSFSRLAPYDRWETFKDEAAQLFDLYREIINPISITRSAVRFINRFNFTKPSIELSEYLRIFPQVPENFEMKGLTMQVIIAQDELNSTLVISQALVPASKVGEISLLLDFDLFNEEVRPCTNEIWDFFEKLHVKKNEIFERSITDKTREMIS